jgi:hypothetical protein
LKKQAYEFGCNIHGKSEKRRTIKRWLGVNELHGKPALYSFSSLISIKILNMVKNDNNEYLTGEDVLKHEY